MQKRNAILVIGVLAASIVLASQAQNFLYINGKKYQSGFFHEGENTWIDAKALKAATQHLDDATQTLAVLLLDRAMEESLVRRGLV